jgi:hypothetical protein
MGRSKKFNNLNFMEFYDACLPAFYAFYNLEPQIYLWFPFCTIVNVMGKK